MIMKRGKEQLILLRLFFVAALFMLVTGCSNKLSKPNANNEEDSITNLNNTQLGTEVEEVVHEQEDNKSFFTCPNKHHPHIIDLNLPSGTLWACCNIGALAPDEPGNFYAWGETFAKEEYNWNTYKWCKNGNVNKITKYCKDPYYGNPDNKTTLDLEDDAAYVVWGEQWRMPTEEELIELMRNTFSEWIDQNGTTGLKLTSKTNGASIFLPSTMLSSQMTQEEVELGAYISSTLDASFTMEATCYFAIADEDFVSSRRRDLRSSVRPVRRM